MDTITKHLLAKDANVNERDNRGVARWSMVLLQMRVIEFINKGVVCFWCCIV